MFKKIILLCPILFVISCAQLHHVQLGEIDSNPKFVQKPFEIKISEIGVDIQEAGRITKAIAGRNSNNEAEKIANLIALFQMGPRTGAPVYVKDYAKNLIQLVYEKCPSGRVTGLASIRETRKYPIISGEIVKLTGYCLLPKGG